VYKYKKHMITKCKNVTTIISKSENQNYDFYSRSRQDCASRPRWIESFFAKFSVLPILMPRAHVTNDLHTYQQLAVHLVFFPENNIFEQKPIITFNLHA